MQYLEYSYCRALNLITLLKVFLQIIHQYQKVIFKVILFYIQRQQAINNFSYNNSRFFFNQYQRLNQNLLKCHKYFNTETFSQSLHQQKEVVLSFPSAVLHSLQNHRQTLQNVCEIFFQTSLCIVLKFTQQCQSFFSNWCEQF